MQVIAGMPFAVKLYHLGGDAFEQQVESQSTALFATGRLWDDGIIDPRDTRRILGLCLALAAEAADRRLNANTFGVARL